ncbi:hypothetical protein BG000_007415 [Podila horticola]|nr:hypothetical protein BG000_007415 [Podila horticola]
MTSQPARPLQPRHLFLAALGVVLLGLNATMIGWVERARGAVTLEPLSGTYASLLVPDVAMVLLYLVLANGRPRLSNQSHHTRCRILSSLALAVGLLYYPSAYLDAQVQARSLASRYVYSNDRSSRLIIFSRSLAEDYFCIGEEVSWGRPKSVVNAVLNVCRVHASSGVLSFLAAFMVVLELFLARRRDDIGEKKEEKGVGEAWFSRNSIPARMSLIAFIFLSIPITLLPMIMMKYYGVQSELGLSPTAFNIKDYTTNSFTIQQTFINTTNLVIGNGTFTEGGGNGVTMWSTLINNNGTAILETRIVGYQTMFAATDNAGYNCEEAQRLFLPTDPKLCHNNRGMYSPVISGGGGAFYKWSGNVQIGGGIMTDYVTND